MRDNFSRVEAPAIDDETADRLADLAHDLAVALNDADRPGDHRVPVRWTVDVVAESLEALNHISRECDSRGYLLDEVGAIEMIRECRRRLGDVAGECARQERAASLRAMQVAA